MTRVLAPLVALLAFAAPATAQNPEPLIKRLGALPGEMVKAGRTDAEMADALFLITLGRLPNEKEKEGAVKLLGADPKKRAAAGRDLAWALINTKEFLRLHSLDDKPVEALKLIEKLVKEWGKEDEKEKK